MDQNSSQQDARVMFKEALHILGFLVAGLFSGFAHSAELPLTIKSLDSKVIVTVAQDSEAQLTYSIRRNGETIVAPSALRVRVVEGDLEKVELMRTTTRVVKQKHRLVATKATEARDNFRELTVILRPRSGITTEIHWQFRAYDDGVAFRYRVPANARLKTLAVQGEETEFTFAGDYACHGLNVGRFDSSHEGEFTPIKASLIPEHSVYDLPLVCRTEKNAFALTEANLVDYGGLYFRGRGDGKLGVQPIISPRLDDKSLIALVPIGIDGAGSPWRVIMLGDRLGDLIGSNLVGNLNPDPSFDTTWVKSGKSAWDWWSGPWLPPPDKGGTDMHTIQKYIDFAGKSGFEYMMVDEGWCLNSGSGGSAPVDADVTKAKDGLDMTALVAYGAKQNVGLWLWVQWSLLDRQMDAALEQYQKWGIKGIKVDFMNRNDQQMVDYYHQLMRKAAEHHLMVDMHGAYPPTGLNRTWPNYLSQEGVMGAEHNKWGRHVTASHNVGLAYTRMLLGPMDYTPGGFRNTTSEAFQVVFSPPRVATTRGHGLGMYVVYESPIQMVADSPDIYESAAGFDFLEQVPASWDETRFLGGEIDSYVAVARRKRQDWYVGVMGNEQTRRVTVPLGFLGGGKFEARIWEDGATPTTLNVRERSVNSRDILTLDLAPSGGAVVRFTR